MITFNHTKKRLKYAYLGSKRKYNSQKPHLPELHPYTAKLSESDELCDLDPDSFAIYMNTKQATIYQYNSQTKTFMMHLG